MLRVRQWLRKSLQIFLYTVYLAVVVIALLELMYRFQVVDFFQTELRTLNSVADLENTDRKKTLLLFGDSFSVQTGSYVQTLRDSLPQFRVINAAVTGTSPEETRVMFAERVKDFKPDVVVYQLYVGNDLLGMRHTLNWKTIAWYRNVYWWLSERIHVLWYINYKLGQWSSQFKNLRPVDAPPSAEEAFDPARYRPLEKIYAIADAGMINNSVMLRDGRQEEMKRLLILLQGMNDEINPGCQFYVVVIPHKSQVSEQYKNDMRSIGFRFDLDFSSVDSTSYPFTEALNNYAKDSNDLIIIDPLPTLRHAASDTSLYFHNDEHLTPAGHSIVGNTVWKRITAH